MAKAALISGEAGSALKATGHQASGKCPNLCRPEATQQAMLSYTAGGCSPGSPQGPPGNQRRCQVMLLHRFHCFCTENMLSLHRSQSPLQILPSWVAACPCRRPELRLSQGWGCSSGSSDFPKPITREELPLHTATLKPPQSILSSPLLPHSSRQHPKGCVTNQDSPLLGH